MYVCIYICMYVYIYILTLYAFYLKMSCVYIKQKGIHKILLYFDSL